MAKLGPAFFDSLLNPFFRRRRAKKADVGLSSSWLENLYPSALAPSDTVGPLQFRWRVLPFSLALVFVFGVIAARLFDLQLINGAKNRERADQNRLRAVTIRPPRGIIYDRRGTVLASSIPGFRVIVSTDSSQSPAANQNLMAILNLSEEEIRSRIEKGRKEGLLFVTLGEGLDQETALKIETNREALGGVEVEIAPLRSYAAPLVYAHLLGFVGQISKEELGLLAGRSPGCQVGKSGVEKVFEETLAGKEGHRLLEIDALAGQLGEAARQEAQAGASLTLTVDDRLQRAAFAALEKGVESSGAVGGAVVVQKVDNGEILAFVSYPSFDAGRFSQGLLTEEEYQRLLTDPAKPLFNRAIQGTYPPGSVFKLVTAAAALSESVVDAQTQINDTGAISIGSFVYPCWKAGGHGQQNVVQALANSCDVFFYTVGGGFGQQPGVGVAKLADWARRFGLGAKTGIALLGEAAGLVPDEEWKMREKGERWYIGNTYHLSIGQGDVLATPLQINNLVAAIANGGTLPHPKIVGGDKNPGGQIGVDEGVLKLIREGMRAAVEWGTAYPLRYGVSFTSAGKTGTAQVGGTEKTHAWFTVFAPYESPEIALTVFLEQGGEGSHNAAPVAKEILEEYFGGEILNSKD